MINLCRYAISGPYKIIYACFKCRKSYKQKPVSDLKNEADKTASVLCPQCRTVMNNMGHDFKAPRQSGKKQWKKVEILFKHGFAYHSCGCGGAGYRPAKLYEIEGFLKENLRLSDGEKLLQRLSK